jgi:hypothetical protein
MSELIWLSNYSRQTTDELLALAPTHRIDSLTSAFANGLWKKEQIGGTDTLTEEEWIVVAVETWLCEVHNGSFHQFFYNPSVRFALDIVAAVQRIGCPRMAAIAESAIEALHLPELSVEAISEVILKGDPVRDELLAKCTEQVFQYPEPVEERLFEFIKLNRSRITLPP